MVQEKCTKEWDGQLAKFVIHVLKANNFTYDGWRKMQARALEAIDSANYYRSHFGAANSFGNQVRHWRAKI